MQIMNKIEMWFENLYNFKPHSLNSEIYYLIERKKKVIEFNNVSKFYETQNNKCYALREVTTNIEEGEIVAVTGKSGAGKTTFLNVLGAVDEVSSGEIVIDGNVITQMKEKQKTLYRRRKIGFVFQFFNLLPMLTVKENIMLPLEIDKAKKDMEYFQELVENLGITDKLDMLPSMLSGGQQQRVAIARAMIHKPCVILADEPTGNLDSETTKEVMDLLLSCTRKHHQTLIYVTHDWEVADLADLILQISDGRLKEESR